MPTYRLYLEELRIRHWIKNLLVFVPAFFTLQIYKSITDVHLFLTFISFCISASLIYLINDLQDIEADKHTPNNRDRPYAAGRLSLTLMYRMIFILSLLLIIGVTMIGIWIPFIVYIFINFMYTFYLKKIAILDILVICLGFELRIWAGAEAIHVVLSPWLISMVFFLALFLGLSKRKADVIQFSKIDIVSHEKISFYQKLPLQTILYIVAGIIFLLYLTYCFSPEIKTRLSNSLYLSSVFVAMGLGRYLYLILVKYVSMYPTDIIWKDLLLQTIFIAWIGSLLLLIY